MKVVRLDLLLLEPLLINSISGDPNTMTSLDYVPGSAIRGAVIERFRARGRAFEAGGNEVRRLFFDGSTRYLNAYLQLNGERSIPVPLSLRSPKEPEASLHKIEGNWVLDVAAECNIEKYGRQQWRTISGSFCQLSKQAVHRVFVERVINTHCARGRTKGHPTEDDGAVYQIDALRADQTFTSFILCEHDEDASIIKSLAGEISCLGAARGGGYGRVSSTATIAAGSWTETPNSHSNDHGDRHVLSFLSDAIMRTPSGDTSTDRHSLTDVLRDTLNADVQIIAVHLRTRTVSGFNRKWGTPLPSDVAVQAGSVVVLGGDQSLKESLAQLEQAGLGERKVEGFGRVAINVHGSTPELQVFESEQQEPSSTKCVIRKDSSSLPMARLIANNLARRLLDRQVLSLANKYGRFSYLASKSQLNRLRVILENLIMSGANSRTCAEKLEEFMKSVNERQVSRRQFEKMRVHNNQLFVDWMKIRIKNLQSMSDDIIEDFWKEIGLEKEQLPSIGGVRPELGRSAATEYTLRLIHGTIVRANTHATGGR